MKAGCGVCDGRCACEPGPNGLPPSSVDCQTCMAVRGRLEDPAVQVHDHSRGDARTTVFSFPVRMSEHGPTIVATDHPGRFVTASDADDEGYDPIGDPITRLALDDARRVVVAYREDQRREAEERGIQRVLQSIRQP